MPSKNQGQSLLEVVIALGIIVVVLVGLVRVTTLSVRNTSSSQNEAQTARYGTEVSEWLKNEKDILGWVSFKDATATSHPGTWCLPSSPLTIFPDGPSLISYIGGLTVASPSCPSSIAGTNLIRTITIPSTATPIPSPPSLSRAELLEFIIRISWAEGVNTRIAEYRSQITSADAP